MYYATLKNNVVVNVVVCEDETFASSMGWLPLPEEVGIGWSYDGETFFPPKEVPPPLPTREEQEFARRLAYQNESDPIFFMAQRGEATMEDWEDKVAEIKARHPYPEEV